MMAWRDFARNDDIAASVRGPDPTDRLFYKVMITLGVILAILIAASFIGFAWAGA